jgi:hypothetical protein
MPVLTIGRCEEGQEGGREERCGESIDLRKGHVKPLVSWSEVS